MDHAKAQCCCVTHTKGSGATGLMPTVACPTYGLQVVPSLKTIISINETGRKSCLFVDL